MTETERKLRAALQTAQNGLEWYQTEFPDVVGEDDYEAMAEIQAALDSPPIVDYHGALTVWLDKTSWVQDESSAGKLPGNYLGMHRADVMRAEIERLRKERDEFRDAASHLLTSFIDLRNGFPERELHEHPDDTIERALKLELKR